MSLCTVHHSTQGRTSESCCLPRVSSAVDINISFTAFRRLIETNKCAVNICRRFQNDPRDLHLKDDLAEPWQGPLITSVQQDRKADVLSASGKCPVHSLFNPSLGHFYSISGFATQNRTPFIISIGPDCVQINQRQTGYLRCRFPTVASFKALS